jgi:ATP/maltotriose-dependent transcriptional regulator MalT
MVQGNLREALEVLGEAWTRWQVEGDRRLLELHASLGARYAQVLIFLGRLEEALQVAGQALEEARRALSHGAGARVLPALAMANFYLGRYDQALRQAEMTRAMLRYMDNPRLLTIASSLSAMVLLAQGKLDAFWKSMEEIRRESRIAQVSIVQAWSQRIWGDALQLLGAIEEANRVYEPIATLPVGNVYRAETMVRWGIGRILSGDSAAGLALLEETSRKTRAENILLMACLADAARALALALMGRCEESSALTAQLSAVMPSPADMLTFAFAHLAMAIVALKQNNPLEARMKAMALLSRASDHDVVFMEIYALVILILAMRRMGEDAAPFVQTLQERLHSLHQNARNTPLEGYAERLQGWIAMFLQ